MATGSGRQSRSRPRVVLDRLALALGAVIVCLLLVELVLQGVGYWPPLSLDWYLGTKRRVPDPAVIMVRPDFRDDGFYDAQGRATRILAIGDSFTEGFPVDRDAAYPAVLERLLRERGKDVHVLEMGLGNSGPDQHLRLLEEYGLPRYDPDVVVWTFYANDLADNARFPAYGVRAGELVPLDGTRHWLYRRGVFFDRIPLPRKLKKRSALVRGLMQAWEAVHRPPADIESEDRVASGARVALAVRETERLAEAHGFEVLYVLLAPQSVYLQALDPATEPAVTNREDYETLGALLEQEVPLVRVFHDDVVVGSRRGDAGFAAPEFGIFAESDRDDSSIGDAHYDEAGYRRLAEAIAEKLLELE